MRLNKHHLCYKLNRNEQVCVQVRLLHRYKIVFEVVNPSWSHDVAQQSMEQRQKKQTDWNSLYV